MPADSLFVPRVFTSPPLPYYPHAVASNGVAIPKPGDPPRQIPEAAIPDPMIYGITGFRIPSLPAMPTGYSQAPETLVQQILYRFQRYLRELHVTGARRSVALQLMAHPDRATLGSAVGMYVLCRTAEPTAELAAATAARSAQHAFSHFPKEGIFAYGAPVWLSETELKQAMFMTEGGAAPDLAELRKHEERQVWDRQNHTGYIRYVPHRFWPDMQMDPWLVLVENLARVTQPAAIRIELVPTQLDVANGLDEAATAARWFGLIEEDLTRLAGKPDIEFKDKTTGAIREEGLRIETTAAMASAARIAYIKRGKHVFQRLLECSDQLFAIRVLIAAEGEIPEELLHSVRTALATPQPGTPEAALGWVRPEVVRPGQSLSDRGPALRHLNWMAQTRWARDRSEGWYGPDLRYLVTAEEASSLFHLPIVEKAGKTSALSTAETPFVIPPEVLDARRFDPGEPRIRAGYLYQRETLLNPANMGEKAQAFTLPLKRLMMPSLLVGAPGSGKTNMALYLLVQLWRDHKMPFLVLDPSTGQEFRLMLGSKMPGEPGAPVEDHHSTLQDDFIVFTVGDSEGCPLRFNPFAVPPGVSVRSHITRLMAAFKSAYSMPDPFPAVFESALQRLYTSDKYVGEGNAWELDEKGEQRNAFPCLADFSVAMNDELEENVLPSYKGSGEATGILKGGTSIRIDSLFKNLGHILNVRESDPEFFQRMLRRPAVIELGGLGDNTSIALVMAFLLTQLVGHVEHAFNVMRDHEGVNRLHLLLIEEAHRLLSGEGGGGDARGKSAEDLSVMLAEVRKFGQGIMTLDQRPSSLVGGVLDNANIKILTRLHDIAGFVRLAQELNLTEDQQRHARTRLNPGDAIMADWKSGQPVLIRSANVSDGLRAGRLKKEEEREQMLRNAERWGLVSPPAVPYTSQRPGGEAVATGAATAAVAASTPATAPVDKSRMLSRDWMRREVEESADQILKLLEAARADPVLYHYSADRMKEGAEDLDGALAVVSTQMEKMKAEFDRVQAVLWYKMKLAALGIVGEEQEYYGKAPGVTERLRARREAPLTRASAPAAGPVTQSPAVDGAGNATAVSEPVSAPAGSAPPRSGTPSNGAAAPAGAPAAGGRSSGT